jgi:hypothetical protein
MKNLLLLIAALLVDVNAWKLHKGMIVPDSDPELKAAPAAGTKMSMSFATLT